MEQTITIRVNRTTHLTVATLRVYQCLKDKLQDRAEVVGQFCKGFNGQFFAGSCIYRLIPRVVIHQEYT